jgi:Protein of unknown function (DUF1670)
METKIARLFKEAYEQGASLTHSDIAYFLHVSTGTVSKQTKAYGKNREDTANQRNRPRHRKGNDSQGNYLQVTDG